MARMHFLAGACCAVATIFIIGFSPATEAAVEYRLLQPANIETTLNQYAGMGWKLHTILPNGTVILEKGTQPSK